MDGTKENILTLENEQSVDMSVIRQAAKKIKTPSKSLTRRFLRNLPAVFATQDIEESGWGAKVGEIILGGYLSGCRDLSDDRSICEDARRMWDADIMEDLEQHHYDLLLDATNGSKSAIEGVYSRVLRDIRDDARELARTLMWRALNQR